MHQTTARAHDSMTPPLRINLYSDWVRLLEATLVEAGYKPSDENVDEFHLALRYYNAKIREIEAVPRSVHIASSIEVPPEHQEGFEEIVRKARDGESLNPHLSKSLLDAEFRDHLLNDWGLHHMHLGKVAGPSGFVDRTGPLLFAHVKDRSIYFLAVRPHGAWTDESLMEIMSTEWPELLEPYELRGATPITSVSPDERQKLRKGGVNTLTTLSNGKSYFSLGGGTNTAGGNIRAVSYHDHWADFLQKVEQRIREELTTLEAQLPADRRFDSPPEFRLHAISGDGIQVLETHSKVSFTFRTPW